MNVWHCLVGKTVKTDFLTVRKTVIFYNINQLQFTTDDIYCYNINIFSFSEINLPYRPTQKQIKKLVNFLNRKRLHDGY